MKLHELKTWPPFFQDIKDEKKTFDVRPDDRNFKVGDYLLLWEWNPDAEDYTGREILVEIVYKVPGGPIWYNGWILCIRNNGVK